MKRLLVAVFATTLTVSALAETAGFQLSLVPDVAIQSRDTEIRGVSLGIWNENPGSQWQIGFVNGATGDSAGLQWGVFIPTILNYAESYTGAQVGLVNFATGEFVGLQLGAVNYANALTGVQWGAVNVAKAVDGGFQLGFVNYSEAAKNLLQVGVVNVITDNKWFADFPSDLAQGMVFVNWSFK